MKHSAQYAAFTNAVEHILSVPKTEILRCEAEYRKQADLNPRKRGPKRKVTPSASPGGIARFGIENRHSWNFGFCKLPVTFWSPVIAPITFPSFHRTGPITIGEDHFDEVANPEKCCLTVRNANYVVSSGLRSTRAMRQRYFNAYAWSMAGPAAGLRRGSEITPLSCKKPTRASAAD